MVVCVLRYGYNETIFSAHIAEIAQPGVIWEAADLR